MDAIALIAELNSARTASALAALVALAVILWRVHPRSDRALACMRAGLIVLAVFEIAWAALAALGASDGVVSTVAWVRCSGWALLIAPIFLRQEGSENAKP